MTEAILCPFKPDQECLPSCPFIITNKDRQSNLARLVNQTPNDDYREQLVGALRRAKLLINSKLAARRMEIDSTRNGFQVSKAINCPLKDHA